MHHYEKMMAEKDLSTLPTAPTFESQNEKGLALPDGRKPFKIGHCSSGGNSQNHPVLSEQLALAEPFPPREGFFVLAEKGHSILPLVVVVLQFLDLRAKLDQSAFSSFPLGHVTIL